MKRATSKKLQGKAIDNPPLRSVTPAGPADRDELERAAAAILSGLSGRETSADGRLVVEAGTELPTEHGVFDVRLFRFEGRPEEHLAISLGDVRSGGPLLVRVHSECLTGEVLRSMKCDCGDQLGDALARIQRGGRGMVLYLRQEGRGIGLANKLRAYALQRLGADTVDANRLLGLPDDARDYRAAAALLAHDGMRKVRLLTNNPAKVDALVSLGIEVVERVPVLVANNPVAQRYLATKRDRMAHLVP